jgi:hypothetical protein
MAESQARCMCYQRQRGCSCTRFHRLIGRSRRIGLMAKFVDPRKVGKGLTFYARSTWLRSSKAIKLHKHSYFSYFSQRSEARRWLTSLFFHRKDNTLYQDRRFQQRSGIYFFAGRTGANTLRRGLVAFNRLHPRQCDNHGSDPYDVPVENAWGLRGDSLSKVSRDWGAGRL